MARYILLSSLLLLAAAGFSVAQEATLSPDVQEMAAAADAYRVTPRPRHEIEAHMDKVYFWLDYLDGRILAGNIEDGDTWLLFWNSDTQSLEATLNDEPIELIQSEDKAGRLTFEAGVLNGWLDIRDGYLLVEAELIDAERMRYIGPLAEALNEPNIETPVCIVATTKKCVCKGTNESNGCNEDTDCQNASACSYTKNGELHQSKCVFAYTPKDKLTSPPPRSLDAIHVEPLMSDVPEADDTQETDEAQPTLTAQT